MKLFIAAIAFFYTLPAQAQSIDGTMAYALDVIDLPLRILLATICFILGIYFNIKGLSRFRKTFGREGAAYTKTSCALLIVTGWALISLPDQMNMLGRTFFGDAGYTYATLSYESEISKSNEALNQLIKVILRIVQLSGIIWSISALFNINDASDGTGGKTIRGSITRMIASVFCYYIYNVINVVQNTLNLQILDLS